MKLTFKLSHIDSEALEAIAKAIEKFKKDHPNLLEQVEVVVEG